MIRYRKIIPSKTYMGRLSYGCDLIEEVTNICRDLNIRLGRVEAIGAVQKAEIGFYNQKTRSYQFSTLDFPAEIVSLIGNISLKDGESFFHAHVTLADENQKSYGGHLGPGTIVFACEFIVQSFEGANFDRSYDDETGLPLWELG